MIQQKRRSIEKNTEIENMKNALKGNDIAAGHHMVILNDI